MHSEPPDASISGEAEGADHADSGASPAESSTRSPGGDPADSRSSSASSSSTKSVKSRAPRKKSGTSQFATPRSASPQPATAGANRARASAAQVPTAQAPAARTPSVRTPAAPPRPAAVPEGASTPAGSSAPEPDLNAPGAPAAVEAASTIGDVTISDVPIEDVTIEDPPAVPAVTGAPALDAPQSASVSTTGRSDTAPAVVLAVIGLTKTFDDTAAVRGIDLQVRAGSIFGIVGPNGAGKTTTLSMITGLLRPDSGRVLVRGTDVWANPVAAKKQMGVLPDRLRLFDRLTGAQLLYYAGTLRELDRATVRKRSSDLASAFGLEDALGRLVTDYSAGMMKKIALAAAMIHSPRLLVLDEPFEAVDPVSAANVIEILHRYAAAGGTVVLSSHSMDLIERMCDFVAIIVRGEVLASGTVDEVRRGSSLENRFIELAGGRKPAEGMEWLHNF